MRRSLNPLGLLGIAALATPLIVKSAKPLAKKVGKGIRDLGEKLVESVEKMEAEERDRKATATARETTPGDSATEEKSEEPKQAAKSEEPISKVAEPATKESKAGEPQTESKPKAATTKVKQSKPAAKKRATKSTSKTVKAKRTTRRSAKDVGETG